MKAFFEKQLVHWNDEVAKLVDTRYQAQRVLEEETKTILMIEGGIQSKEMLLRKIEQESEPTGTIELNQQAKPKSSK